MRRPLRWLLGIPAALALTVGAIVWDTNRRAWKAFEQHEQRVAVEIAGLRARHAAAPVHAEDPVTHLEPFLLADAHPLRELAKRAEDGEYFPYEGGGTYRWYLGRKYLPLRELSLFPNKTFLQPLGAAQDVLRGGGADAAYVRLALEHTALMGFRDALEVEPLTAPEARRIIRSLDALAQSRPPIQDAILAEHVLECRTIIKILRERQDPLGYVTEKPGKKSLYSWKILLVQRLNETVEEYRQLSRLRADTVHELFVATMHKEEELTRGRRFPSHDWHGVSPAVLLQRDALVRDRWLLARVATAIAGYQGEQGRLPVSIEDLLPGWLSELPRSPYSGSPFQYRDGRLSSPTHEVSGGDTGWRVWQKR